MGNTVCGLLFCFEACLIVMLFFMAAATVVNQKMWLGLPYGLSREANFKTQMVALSGRRVKGLGEKQHKCVYVSFRAKEEQ